jgi:hypothetical protein
MVIENFVVLNEALVCPRTGTLEFRRSIPYDSRLSCLFTSVPSPMKAGLQAAAKVQRESRRMWLKR